MDTSKLLTDVSKLIQHAKETDDRLAAQSVTIATQSNTIAAQGETIAAQGHKLSSLVKKNKSLRVKVKTQKAQIIGASAATALLVVGEIAGELRQQCYRKAYGATYEVPPAYRPSDVQLASLHIPKAPYLQCFRVRVGAGHPCISDLSPRTHIAQYLLAVFPHGDEYRRFLPLLTALQCARELYGLIPPNGRMLITPEMVAANPIPEDKKHEIEASMLAATSHVNAARVRRAAAEAAAMRAAEAVAARTAAITGVAHHVQMKKRRREQTDALC